jgi:hypothetical protein
MNTDVEELLREGMERYTADLRAPAGLTYRVAARRRRRLTLRSLTGGAAALAAGAAALAAIVVPAASGAGRPAVDAAYVIKNVSNALSAAEPGTIAQMTITTTIPAFGGVRATTTTAQEWSNGNEWRSVTYSSPGHPAYDEGFSTASGYTLVSYPTKTWARQAGVGQPAVKTFGTPLATRDCGAAVAGFPVLFRLGLPATSTSASSLPTTVAAALHVAVSCGALSVAGRQTVDGTDAIELTSRAGSPLTETIWVNPSTYLPVRVVASSPYGTPGLQQTADFSWLPPTAQNLAKLAVPIPAGFRQVSLSQAVMPNLKVIPAGSLPAPAALCPATAGGPCAYSATPSVPFKGALAVPRPAILCFVTRLPRPGGVC